MVTGYLIHIDGALTKEHDAVDPSVDKRLLTRLESVLYDGGKIALITGRTEKWLDQHLFPLIGDANFLTESCSSPRATTPSGRVSMTWR